MSAPSPVAYAPLAIPSDLAVVSSGTLSNDDAIDLLARASADARSYCRWSISEESYDVTMDSAGDTVILLPAMHVTAITSATEGGVSLVEDTDFTWSESGVVERPSQHWARGRRNIHVEFTAGYSPVPQDVVGVVCSLAARVAALKGGFTQQRIGSLSLGQSLTAGSGLGHFETDVLDRYRLS